LYLEFRGWEISDSYTDLNDLVARELEIWDVHSIAGHQVAVENTEDGLMGNDKEVILLSLKFENDWLKTDRQIMV
jgi:hypothetical protein